MARNLIFIACIAAFLASTPDPAGAARSLGSFSFGAAPAAKAGLGPRSYFSFTTVAGTTLHDSLLVTNGSSGTQTLAISPSVGSTARNSGYGYADAFERCRGAACWIHGLPSKITLAPRGRKVIPFTVEIPSGTRDRQYLAGITVQPAKLPQPTKIGSRGGVGAQATVITRVNVGLAITIGELATLRHRLEILGVRVLASAVTPQIVVTEQNTGETFVSATGTAVCLDGSKRFAYPLISRTVLPGDRAVLSLAAADLRRGASLRCRATLDFGGGATPAVWRGAVKVPSTPAPKVVQTGPHTFSQVPKSRIPKWAIALIAAGGAIVLGLLVVIVVLLRRRPPAST